MFNVFGASQRAPRTIKEVQSVVEYSEDCIRPALYVQVRKVKGEVSARENRQFSLRVVAQRSDLRIEERGGSSKTQNRIELNLPW